MSRKQSKNSLSTPTNPRRPGFSFLGVVMLLSRKNPPTLSPSKKFTPTLHFTTLFSNPLTTPPNNTKKHLNNGKE